MLSKIKELFTLSTGIKLIIGGLAGFFCQRLFIYIGLCYFSIKEGIRIPTENSEIMPIAGTLIAQSISIFGGVFFVLFMLVINKLYEELQAKNDDEIKKISKQIKFRLVFSALFLMLYFIIDNQYYLKWISFALSYIFAIMAISASLRQSIQLRYYYVPIATAMFVLSLFISFIAHFDLFLRLTKYGGGYKIELSNKCENIKEECPPSIVGYLVLRSTKYCFVYLPEKNVTKEIYISDKTIIEYSSSKETWKLPSQQKNIKQ